MILSTEQLVTFVREEIAVGGDVESDTDLLLTGAVDSLGVIRITHFIEEETGLVVDPADVTLENFQTIDRMVAYVERTAN